MQWHSEGIVVSVVPHGESHAVLGVLTRGHGFHRGYVYGGGGRKKRPVLEPGNLVDLRWSSRLEDALGTFSVEPVENFAAVLFHDPVRLAALGAMTGLLYHLPEREPFPGLHDDTMAMLDLLRGDDNWYSALVVWELRYLGATGFGLDLEKCAVTGQAGGLALVSPKTGRAVTLEAGRLYRDRLLPLPGFLQGEGSHIRSQVNSAGDVMAGFRLTGFFLDRMFREHLGTILPDARNRATGYISSLLHETS